MIKNILLTILLLGGVMTVNAFAGETLSNGVRFKQINRDYTNTVSIAVFIKGGLFRENTDNNGIGSLFARNWIKSGALLEQVEFIGGFASASMANDYLEFTLSVPTDNLD